LLPGHQASLLQSFIPIAVRQDIQCYSEARMQPAPGLLLTGADVVSTLIFLVAVVIPGGAAVAKRPEDVSDAAERTGGP
jgi:hypothetical protein